MALLRKKEKEKFPLEPEGKNTSMNHQEAAFILNIAVYQILILNIEFASFANTNKNLNFVLLHSSNGKIFDKYLGFL